MSESGVKSEKGFRDEIKHHVDIFQRFTGNFRSKNDQVLIVHVAKGVRSKINKRNNKFLNFFPFISFDDLQDKIEWGDQVEVIKPINETKRKPIEQNNCERSFLEKRKGIEKRRKFICECA